MTTNAKYREIIYQHLLHFDNSCAGDAETCMILMTGSRGRGDYRMDSDADVVFVYDCPMSDSVKLRDRIRFRSREHNIDYQGFELKVFLRLVAELDPHIWESLINSLPIKGVMTRNIFIDQMDSDAFFRLMHRFTSAHNGIREKECLAITEYQRQRQVARVKMAINYAEMAEILFSFINTNFDEVKGELQTQGRKILRMRLANEAVYEKARNLLIAAARPGERKSLAMCKVAFDMIAESVDNVHRCVEGCIKQIREREGQAHSRFTEDFNPDNPELQSLIMLDGIHTTYQSTLFTQTF